MRKAGGGVREGDDRRGEATGLVLVEDLGLVGVFSGLFTRKEGTGGLGGDGSVLMITGISLRALRALKAEGDGGVRSTLVTEEDGGGGSAA